MNYFHHTTITPPITTPITNIMPLSRAALFRNSSARNYEFERYLTSSEPKPSGPIITVDSTRSYVMTLPLSYFVSTRGIRSKGKADAMPYESFRIINVQHLSLIHI